MFSKIQFLGRRCQIHLQPIVFSWWSYSSSTMFHVWVNPPFHVVQFLDFANYSMLPNLKCIISIIPSQLPNPCISDKSPFYLFPDFLFKWFCPQIGWVRSQVKSCIFKKNYIIIDNHVTDCKAGFIWLSSNKSLFMEKLSFTAIHNSP